jgi:hypothetical protein
LSFSAGRLSRFVLPKTFVIQDPPCLFATPAPSPASELKLLAPAIPIPFSSSFTFSLIRPVPFFP